MEKDRTEATLVDEDEFYLVSVEKPGGRISINLFGDGKSYGGNYKFEKIDFDINGNLKVFIKSDKAKLGDGVFVLSGLDVSKLVSAMSLALNRLGHHISEIRDEKEQDEYERKFPLGDPNEDNDNSRF